MYYIQIIHETMEKSVFVTSHLWSVVKSSLYVVHSSECNHYEISEAHVDFNIKIA